MRLAIQSRCASPFRTFYEADREVTARRSRGMRGCGESRSATGAAQRDVAPGLQDTVTRTHEILRLATADWRIFAFWLTFATFSRIFPKHPFHAMLHAVYSRRFMDDFRSSMRFALTAGADLTGTILVPAFAAALLGKFLDARYGTGHILFAAILFLTFLGTAFILVKKVRQYAKEYQKLIAP